MTPMHTPGPWRHTGTGIDARAFDGSWKWLTPVVHGGTPTQATANRALMAAAPELLEAAHAAFHALKSYQYGNVAPALAEECAATLSHAIAKAEGVKVPV